MLVNAAAIEICLNDVSMLDNRGELLQKARKKVADDGYVFKKGQSRSKLYGQLDTTKSKRPKLDKDMREERLQAIDEEVKDIARMLQFKEKRLSQAEAGRNYKQCEQVTEEVMALKSRKRDLDAEKRLLEQKSKRAKRRNTHARALTQQYQSEASDTGSGTLPGTTSGSLSGYESSSSNSRSVTPVNSLATLKCSNEQQSPPSSPPPGSHTNPIKYESNSDVNRCSSTETTMLERPQPLSPSEHGSRINPILCESHSDFDPQSPTSGTDSHDSATNFHF